MKKWLRSCFAIMLMVLTPLLYARADAHVVEGGAEAQTVTFGANESPPFWASTMPNSGMCGAIIQAIAQEAAIPTSIEFKPLPRLIQDDTGNDLGNPAFFMADQDYSAIIPISVYQSALFYYAPNHSKPVTIGGLEDLKKYRIGILKGTLLDRSFFRQHGIAFAESYHQESLFKKLKLGRIDLVLEIDLVGYYMVKELFPGDIADFGHTVLANSANPITMMLAEDTPVDIAREYRDGLKRIIANGTYLDILERYYGVGNVPSDWFDHLARFERMYNFAGDE